MSQPTSSDSSRRSSIVDVSGTKVKKFMNGWTKEQEVLMAEWSDVASCYRWLHDRAEKKFYRLNLSISIPVIVLSTLTGAATFAVDSFIPPGQAAVKSYVGAGLGSVSILAGILTTLGNFFQYAQKSESNRVASIAWGKFQRLLAVELAINPMDRIEAMDFLKICRQDLDRLIEQAPQIPDDIIKAFEDEFKDTPKLKVPDICHGIEHTRIFDASKARLAQVAADAMLHLRYKKNMLANSVMPDINKKVGQELDTRIEQRIREIMGATGSTDASSTVAVLERDWRRLLMNRRLLQSEYDEDLSGAAISGAAISGAAISGAAISGAAISLPPVRPDEVRINVVGQDGSIASTPAGSETGSVHSEQPTMVVTSGVSFD